MDKRLQQFCSIKLHYRHGNATMAFQDDTVFGVIHSHKKVAANLYEVFILYKAYKRFIQQYGWSLLIARFAHELDIDIQGKSLNQVTKEISTELQIQSKEMGEPV